MQIIMTSSICQQPCLVPTPQPAASSQLLSLLYKQIVRDDNDLNKSWKKKKKRRRENRIPHPFWNPRELWAFFFFLA